MASRQHSTESMRPAPRLYLVIPPVENPAVFVQAVADAFDADGDVAAVLVRLPEAENASLIKGIKTLAAHVQGSDAALLLDGHLDLVAPTGADGVHATETDALSTALAQIKPLGIVGAGELASRDDAMRAGELGADYVMFGEPDGAGERPSLQAIVDRVAWWAELFVVPCVAYAASVDEVGPLVAAGADFIAVEAIVFSDPRGVRTAVRDLMGHLRLPETTP